MASILPIFEFQPIPGIWFQTGGELQPSLPKQLQNWTNLLSRTLNNSAHLWSWSALFSRIIWMEIGPSAKCWIWHSVQSRTHAPQALTKYPWAGSFVIEHYHKRRSTKTPVKVSYRAVLREASKLFWEIWPWNRFYDAAGYLNRPSRISAAV